jgi:hypothetical protein
MSPNKLFKDLISVPGLRNVLLFKKNENPIIKDIHEDFSLPESEKDQVLGGLKNAIDKIDEDSFRVELRGEYGRFIICSLSMDMSIALVTNENLNVPLLEMALKQYKNSVEQNQDEVIAEFKDETDIKSYSSKIPSTIASYSSVKSLKSFDSIKEILDLEPQEKDGYLTNDFETNCADCKSYQDLSESFREVSSIAFKVLGKSVVANYWKQTQPDVLKNAFEILLDGTVKAINSSEIPSSEELVAGTNWIKAFIQRCKKFITDAPF